MPSRENKKTKLIEYYVEVDDTTRKRTYEGVPSRESKKTKLGEDYDDIDVDVRKRKPEWICGISNKLIKLSLGGTKTVPEEYNPPIQETDLGEAKEEDQLQPENVGYEV
ncbi:uncharacterized protein LOC123564727 [Mercenaria mercenaria]|uniref:uncharacterized protein LOC123564727 n=1 Tax=Mercenaria mercenaria TaxID=6596 RepID=UPI00234FB21A|nr:uncharacterized protein LOC123564727 [Mercenaria mercenaria]XP_045214427.2 uncharacterized protein LOC123564727 [Mercenaria mercenaria]XP_045214428.2 uncharacterized protein LOC123564727 [Mercenaria mercenaria]